MDRSEATMLVALIEGAYGKEMPLSRATLYAEELTTARSCFSCAEVGVRSLIREARFLPSLAEVLESVRGGVCVSHDPSLRIGIAAKHEWTAEDAIRSREVGKTVMADWMKRHATINRELDEAAKFDSDAATFERKAKRESRPPSPRCDGSGREPEWDGRRWVCPGCGSPTMQSAPPVLGKSGRDR